MELCLGMDKEPTKSSWVSTTGRAQTSEITEGVCYGLHDKEEQEDEALSGG